MTHRPAHMEILVLLAPLLVLMHATARGQYYEEPEFRPSEARYLYAGAVRQDFSPRGSNAAPDSERIHYAKVMPMIGFRQGPVDLFFGYTKFNERGKSNTAMFLGTVISTELRMSGQPGSAFAIPLMVAADFARAESGGPERENFNIASFGLGVGLTYRVAAPGLDFSVRAGELVQFASQGLSTGTGFSAATLADASLILREIVLNGLALGYRFRYQTWSMSEERFNYQAVSHGPYLGILF
jgi:hypothetical protein